jgi:predicted transcriptional regulator
MRINQIPKEQMLREGQFLAERMQELDVSQDEIAHELGLVQSTVSKWVTGTKPIPPQRFTWLASRLSFDPFEMRPELMSFSANGNSFSQEKMKLAGTMAKILLLSDDQECSKIEKLLAVFLPSSGHQKNTQE